MEVVLLDVALYVNQQLMRMLYMNVHCCTGAALASLLCHLTALNKITLIAYERVRESWSGS